MIIVLYLSVCLLSLTDSSFLVDRPRPDFVVPRYASINQSHIPQTNKIPDHIIGTIESLK